MTISQKPPAPLVVVVGATGIQGGSVIKALIQSDKPYRLRGLMRDTSKPAARKMVDQGVEMVDVLISADNAEKVHQAFEGANIAFVSAFIRSLAGSLFSPLLECSVRR
jgi:uncharacterized protein YbjT (DUF2867 family)